MAKRTSYRNGDEITLQSCGCDGCAPAMIQGVLCHETGCPDAWRDYTKKCRECGCKFLRTDRWQVECEDCIFDDGMDILDQLGIEQEQES